MKKNNSNKNNLEIICINRKIYPYNLYLHLSFSGGNCNVWAIWILKRKKALHEIKIVRNDDDFKTLNIKSNLLALFAFYKASLYLRIFIKK